MQTPGRHGGDDVEARVAVEDVGERGWELQDVVDEEGVVGVYVVRAADVEIVSWDAVAEGELVGEGRVV